VDQIFDVGDRIGLTTGSYNVRKNMKYKN